MTSISGTFLKFIDPILKDLGYPSPKDPKFDGAIKMGWLVWNAVVKNDIGGDPSYLLLLKETVPPQYSNFTEMFVARKRELFSSEAFLIGECEARRKPDGSYTLYADAREVTKLAVCSKGKAIS